MSDWEITGIVEDLGSKDADRWLIIYNVSTDIAEDGVFSLSIPKSVFNTVAAVYEYDISDPEQLDDLFDHVMSMPMMKRTLLREGRMAERADPYRMEPREAKAKVKNLVGELKAGKAQLKAASRVNLGIRGEPEVADPSENPKYIIKRDMMNRLDPEGIAKHREMYRAERQTQMRGNQ